MITAKQAKNLAVSYNAFLEANKEGDSRKMALWANELINDQRSAGVELLPEANLKWWIEDAA